MFITRTKVTMKIWSPPIDHSPIILEESTIIFLVVLSLYNRNQKPTPRNFQRMQSVMKFISQYLHRSH